MDTQDASLLTLPLDPARIGAPGEAGPLLRGSLSAFRVGALLSLLNMQKQSGLLTLHNRGFVGQVWVENGEVVDARLGVSRGLYALFETMCWGEGEFFFVVAPIEARSISLSLPVIQLRAALWLDRWRDVLQAIPSLGHRIAVCPAPLGDVVIKRYQWSVLTRIVTGPLTIAELALDLDYPTLDVMRACAELLQVGLCQLLPPLEDGWIESKVLL
jgi:Domain of unknown function (DUF4388)